MVARVLGASLLLLLTPVVGTDDSDAETAVEEVRVVGVLTAQRRNA